jgi:hypothetical protein
MLTYADVCTHTQLAFEPEDLTAFVSTLLPIFMVLFSSALALC